MKIIAVIGGTLLLGIATHCIAQNATPTQLAICKNSGSALVIAKCDDLALEFNNKSVLGGNPVPLQLSDPFAATRDLISVIRQKALQKVLTGQLDGLLQTTLNNVAQIVSTKAAVTQTGATASATAATNLAIKPTTTDLISLAAESGAFTDTKNGNTITAEANANGLRRYLSHDQFATTNPTAADYLRHLTVAASFALTENASTSVSTTGRATTSTPLVASVIVPANNISFNSLAVNYSFYRRCDLNSRDFVAAWRGALTKSTNSDKLLAAIKIVESAIVSTSPFAVTAEQDAGVKAALSSWQDGISGEEQNSDFQTYVSQYASFLDAFAVALLEADRPNNDSDIVSLATNLDVLESVSGDMLDDSRGEPLFTLNYTFATPQNKPATHTVTFVGAYVFKKRWSGAQLTGDAAGSWFTSVPTGAIYGRLQSFQFAGEYDQPIGPKTAPRAVFTLAGAGQYQYNATVLNITAANLYPGTNITLPGDAQVLLGTPGWLAIAQSKVVFNIGKAMSIPVAFKWSSKTDLVQQGDWKGQFGFTYDLSALKAILTGQGAAN